MTPTITFDSSLAGYILSCFGWGEDEESVIRTEHGKGQIIEATDGKPVKISEMAGIINTAQGPKIVRKDIFGLMELADYKPYGTTNTRILHENSGDSQAPQ